jgi:predicted nucleic acid-binding protein
MQVLDTTILIDALRGKRLLLERSRNWKKPKKQYAPLKSMLLSYIRVHNLPTKSDEDLQKVKKLLDAFVVLPINDDTYEWFAALSAELKSRGESINHFDELIVAISMTNVAEVVSSDSHFKRIPGLGVVSY